MSDDEAIGEYWGGALRFGCVPIGSGKLYWFAVATSPPHQHDGDDPRAELLERYDGWPLEVCEIIGRTDRHDILRTDSFDRPPTRRWGRGPVTLLGDAAHAMTPNLGQGGCQAVEDAAILARMLEEHGTRCETLRAYERRRIPRANGFVRRSFSFGRFAHLESRVARSVLHALLRWTPVSISARQLELMYRFDPEV